MDRTLEHKFRIGDFDVDSHSNEVVGPDGPVPLEPLVMNVLVCLANRAGEVVTRETIIAEVWRRPTTDQVLDRCISELRSALGDDARRPAYVKTYPKSGYKLLREPSSIGGWRVLVVDDEELIRHSFVLALREYDSEIVSMEARSCEDAQARFAGRDLDLVFLDLGLSGVSGIDAIKKMQELFDARIVVFSGSEDRETIEGALALGAAVAGYMPKTMTFERLKPALDLIRNGGRYIPEELFGG